MVAVLYCLCGSIGSLQVPCRERESCEILENRPRYVARTTQHNIKSESDQRWAFGSGLLFLAKKESVDC